MNQKQRIIDILDDILLSYYEGGGLPSEKQIEISALGDVADDCFLAVYEGEKFKFSFIGQNIIKSFGSKFFSKDITNILYPDNQDVYNFFIKAMETKQPQSYDDVFKNEDNIELKYREKIYPLSDGDNDEVKYIFGGMRWKTEF